MMTTINGKNQWLNLHHLYYFYVIVQEGSLTKASDVLLVGPPTLSSQLKQLEGSLGYDLFTRKSKKFEMTPEGKKVFTYAEKIFQLGQELVEALHSKSSASGRNTLRVGVPDSLPKELFIGSLRRVMEKPDATVNIKAGKSEELLTELKNNHIDILFLDNQPVTSEQKGLHIKKIASSPIVVSAHPNFNKLKNNFPKSLTDAPFMLSLTDTKIREVTDNFFKSEKVKVNLIGETKDESMQKIFALEGLCLIVTPQITIKDLVSSGKLTELGKINAAEEEIFLVTSEKWLQSGHSGEIMNLLQL